MSGTAPRRPEAGEQLDALVRVTPPRAWVALAAVLVMLGAVLVWSWAGRVPTTVRGPGLLLAEGGLLHEAVTEGTGMVEVVLADLGTRVQAGQVIARITQPELQQQITLAGEVVAEREVDLQRIRGFADETLNRQRMAMAERRAAMGAIMTAAREREAQLARRLAETEALLAQGIATRPAALAARSAANQASQEVADARNTLAQLDLQLLELTGQGQQRVSDAERALADARRRVEELALRLERQREVRAPAAGRVTEIRAPRGATVRPGTVLLALEDGAERLELVLFIPPRDGRRVRPGMPVRVSPATARWEEFGAMLGEVSSVSEFPATREGMAAILRNDTLVQNFTRDGPAYLARVRLLPDTATVSGHRWTSARGAEAAVAAGTLADATVRVREQPPITLALPLLRELLGFDF